jgi:hypothetical protein
MLSELCNVSSKPRSQRQPREVNPEADGGIEGPNASSTRRSASVEIEITSSGQASESLNF